ncbi:MAG TPA: hypothetical protein VGW35_13045 [Methylomirabilota bacterium]|jgi:hypothetical protein|nr:hypothetical protein [Methylomirabilota bacterium]
MNSWQSGFGSVLAVITLLAAPLPAAPAQERTPRTGGVPLTVKQTRHCSAFAPADWAFTTNPQGSTAEALSADRTMYAGWGVVAINRAQQPFYGDLYGDPEASIRFLTNQLLALQMGDASGLRYTGAPEPFLGYFALRRFESARHAGFVFYRIYPGPNPASYVESVYFAIAAKAQWKTKIRTAAGVVVSIRCVTQLVSTGSGSARPKPNPGSSPRAGCGAGGDLRGYQKELGTQYAYSRSTGQNFLLDPSTDWNENGPQGPGYYRRVGTDYEKLELGRSDDC